MKRELTKEQVQLCEDFGKGPFDKLVDLESLFGKNVFTKVAENYDDDAGTLLAKFTLENIPDDYVASTEGALAAMVSGETAQLENALAVLIDQKVDVDGLDDTVEELLARSLVKVIISLAKKL